MAVVKASGALGEYDGSSGSSMVLSIAGAAVGDTIVLFQGIDWTFPVDPALAAPTGAGVTWTSRTTALAADKDNGFNTVWTGAVTAAGTLSVTIASGARDATINGNWYLLEGAWSFVAAGTTNVQPAATTGAAPSLTAAAGDHLFCAWQSVYTSTTAWTGIPATMTDVRTAAVGAGSGAQTSAREERTVAGATGTRTATHSPSAGFTASSILMRPAVTTETVSGADTGTGADLADTAEQGTATDTALGADTQTVAEQAGGVDTGTGTETVAVADTEPLTLVDTGLGADVAELLDVPAEPIDLAEVGTATDAVTFTNADAADLVDTGAATDALDLAEPFAVAELGTAADLAAVDDDRASTDSAAATDAATAGESLGSTDTGVALDLSALVEWVVPAADSGTGTDTVTAAGDVLGLVDTGDGFDLATILDIPFTQFLPLDTGPTYDLVVVARVPQASGPPTFLEVDPIEWQSLSYTNTLSKPQDLTASCLVAGLTEPVLQRLRAMDQLPSELWLLRDGTRVFAGPLVAWQVSGETLTVQALGLLAYLRLMVIAADLRFDQADQFVMAKAMVDQWQSLEFGDFGIDTSSVGVSGKLRDGTWLRDEMKNVGEVIEQLGQRRDGFDAEVDPASRKLQLWYPGKGVDRSGGEDAVVFDARNITSGDVMCSVALGDLASEGFGTGTSVGAAGPLFSAQSNPELRAKFGRVAVTGTWSDVSEQATLDGHVQGLLDARSTALLVPGPKVRVTPDADLDSYSVGDTVSYELHGQLGVSGAFRIRTQRITVAATGAESVDLEFV